MRHFSNLICFLLAFSLAGSLNAQLSAGDIAFASYDADDPDAFSFLTFTAIPAGTAIKFTDNGWFAAGSFRANEGIWQVTFTMDIACGTEVQVSGSGVLDGMGNRVGDLSTSGSFALATSGDQILAYQGDEASPTFLAAINNEGSGWQADATSANTSALPAGLADGMTAVAVTEIDNAVYGCVPNTGTRAELLMAINTASNWLGSDVTKQVPSGCPFSLSDCGGGGNGNGDGDDCADLFLSEYIEGSSNNKCIELYNPTDAAIGLSDYTLTISRNGGTSVSNIALSGSIPAFSTYVICNPSSAPEFLARADATNGNINHNGDDAYTLSKGGNIIDRFGQLGVDPGTQWSGGGVSTVDRTLVRKESIAKGDPNAADPFDPSLEWDGYPNNEASFLGFHTSVCGPAQPVCRITNISLVDITGCDDSGTESQGDDVFSANIVVEFQDAPATGNLVITGDFLSPASLSVPVSALTSSPFTIDGAYSGAAFAITSLADGDGVSLTAAFTDLPDCTFTTPAAGTAPRACSLPACTPVINELDYNNPGTDDREFVELYNPCTEPINLGGYSIIFVNGANGTIYGNFPLPAITIDPGEFFVICGNGYTTPNCDYDVSPNTNLIQNGDPDAVALLFGSAIADAVSYGGSTNGYTEGSGDGLSDPPTALRGIGRYVDGVDTDQNNADFSVQCVTPGEPNTNTSQYCGLPDDYVVANIGCNGVNDAGYNDFTGAFSISSTCGHVLGSQDRLTFVGQQTCGDAEISARLTGVTPSTAYPGITMRETSAAGSRKISIIRYSNNRKYVEYRANENEPYSIFWLPSYTANTNYVRLTRSGNFFTAFVSFDGNYWIRIYQQFIPMNSCIMTGMVLSSQVDGSTAFADFDNVLITGAAAPAPRPGAPVAAATGQPMKLNLFPNPAADDLTVTVENPAAEEALVSILALDGRQLYRNVHNINGNTVNLHLSALNLRAGMYILTVNTGEDLLTKRFVKANP